MPVIVRPKPLRELESDLMRRIRAALAKMPDVVLFRNNVGVLRDARGVAVRYGLATGSADLVGSVRFPARCPPDGKHWWARSLAIEVKRPGEKPTPEQSAWLEAMKAQGWITGVCTSPEEAMGLVERARRWEV